MAAVARNKVVVATVAERAAPVVEVTVVEVMVVEATEVRVAMEMRMMVEEGWWM